VNLRWHNIFSPFVLLNKPNALLEHLISWQKPFVLDFSIEQLQYLEEHHQPNSIAFVASLGVPIPRQRLLEH
jgi:hypothetical protein